MRDSNEVLTVTDSVTVNKLAAKEEITNYSINKKTKSIDVDIDYYDSNLEFVKSVHYYFDETDYVENASEEDLWRIIDEKRSQDK